MCPESRKIRSIRKRVNSANHRLERARTGPKNRDRALWAALAISTFADVTGQDCYLDADPETILGDLLAGLMHWAVAQQRRKRMEPISFEHALDRARRHFDEEFEAEDTLKAAKRQRKHATYSRQEYKPRTAGSFAGA